MGFGDIFKTKRIKKNPTPQKSKIPDFYKDYSEVPYISPERNMIEWTEQVKMFPQNMVPAKNMCRYHEGLLPGHVYMLYWLNKYAEKTIPAYFEYKYGIDFHREEKFLSDKGYLDNRKPTKAGMAIIEKYKSVIDDHKLNSGLNVEVNKAMQQNSSLLPTTDLVDNNLRGIGFEKQGNVDSAIKLYEYNVSRNFEGNHPYTRLCIIYRKERRYSDEIRIARKAIANLSQKNKVGYFKDRITKATSLKSKNNIN